MFNSAKVTQARIISTVADAYEYTERMIYSDLVTQTAQGEGLLSTASKHGVVYTKSWVTDLILDLVGYTQEADLATFTAIEPAAGDGSFLLPMVRRLIDSCRVFGRDLATASEAIISYELDSESAAEAQTLVGYLLQSNGFEPEMVNHLVSSWIRTGDYLLEAPSLPPADFVIGNPPYIRLEELDPFTAKQYRKNYPTMVGRADLYVAFFEAALRQLKPNGICGFICADRWMLNQYGAELRRLITSAYAVETVMELHRADAFEEDVSAYPAITTIRRAKQGTAVVARAEAGVELLGTANIKRLLGEACRVDGLVEAQSVLRAAPIHQWFSGTDPWPCYSPARLALLKHLEAEFYPLESAGTGTRVSIGVATGADDLFITTDPELVELERLLPLAMAYDTKSGQLEWSGHYLVDPWNERGLVDLSKYPKLRAYYEQHGERLRSRHVGKKSENTWYRTIDRVDHNLTAKPKLYIADIKDRLNPVLDRGETYPHHNLYYVQSAVWDPEVLGGLLLSNVAQFFVECYGVRMRGGYLRFQAQYLRRIRVPRPPDVSVENSDLLRIAFRMRDRAAATNVALRLYGIADLPGDDA